MVSCCANPECRAPFVYLRDGRVFAAIRQDPSLGPMVEYFWLCAKCAGNLSLQFGNDGVANIVQRLRPDSSTSAASVDPKLVA
jgi:hypothetical protein